MVLIILSVAIIAFAIIYTPKKKNFSVLARGTSIIIALVMFMVGATTPIYFDEPELVNTQPIYPLSYVNQNSEEMSGTYLVIQIRKEGTTYCYCMKKDDASDPNSYDETYELIVQSGNITMDSQDVEEPVIETYMQRSGKPIIDLGIVQEKLEYVIRVPNGTIRKEIVDE